MDAAATTTEMVPRQHSDDPTTHQDVGAKESVDVQTCKRWWRDPSYQVPTRRWHGNEDKHASDNFGHGANIGCISYNTCIRSTDGVSGLYL